MATTRQTRNSGSTGRSVIESSGLFSKGLNTELSDIEDAAVYTSEECNCIIRANGSRSRRLGIDYEDGYNFLPENSIDVGGDFAYNSFEWTDISNAKADHYLVVQAGGKLFFYKNTGAPFSREPSNFILDLKEFAIDASTDAYKTEPCMFTQAYGGLFVCSKAVKPFFLNGLEKPDITSGLAYSNPFATVYFGPWNNYTWCREYDARATFFVDDEIKMTSHVVGPDIGNDVPKRYVVLDAAGNKIGRVPMEEVVHTINRAPTDEEMLKGAGLAAIGSMVIPGLGLFLNVVLGGLLGKIFGKKKTHVYTTPVYPMGGGDPIGVMTITGSNSSTDLVLDFNGNKIGTAHLCDDFYRLPSESQWAWGSKNKVVHKPTANYYADLWNNYVAPGKTKTVKEETGLTAYPVTPYTGHWNYNPTFKTVEIASAPLSIELKRDTKLADNAQAEYLVFVNEAGSAYNSEDVLVNWTTWTDKISHRDARRFGRTARFQNFYKYSKKTGLVLQIRDLKGTPDMYKPAGADFEVDLLQGSNVSLRPTGELTPAHRYNLLNQGWEGSAKVDTDGDGKNDDYKPLIEAFHEAMANDPDYKESSWPSNNLQWFVAKDATTRAYASGDVWRGNEFTHFRPADLLQYAFGDTPAPKGHFILDYFKQDRDFVSNIKSGKIPVEYPRCNYVADIATYAGRVFYLTGDTILYSQVVLEDLSKAGNCYQEADPTSEEISDLVDTDGGMIQIPEIGEGIRLVHVGGVLAAVGTRSTYLISGGSENNFTATAYVGGAMQTYSSNSPLSFIETEGSVFYWSTVGIVQLVPGQGGLGSNVFSQGSIQTFYDNIPDKAKEYCRGFFDNATKELWWLYPGDVNKPRVLNKALVCNLKTSAWTPYSFAIDETGDSTYPHVVGGMPIVTAWKVEHKKSIYAEAQSSSVIGSLEEEEDGRISVVINNEDVGFLEGNAIRDEEGSFKYRVRNNKILSGNTVIGFMDDVNNIFGVSHGEVQVEVDGVLRNVLAEDPIETDRSSYKSSVFLCVDTTQSNMTFGVLNNLNYRDWATGDWEGSGYDYESYLVSHPLNLDRPYHKKSTPYLLTTFRRTEQGFDATGNRIYPSACQGAVLWDWNVNGDNGKWDAQQELYRFDKDTLLGSKYITTKTRVYGSGNAFQVKLSSVENRAFDIENVGFQVYIDGRI